jgi:CRP/FNR family cyclic AMP-dependent transcriptional regulator
MFAKEPQVLAFVNLFKKGTKLSYKKGEYIIRPGETPNGVFYIEEGLVKAYNISKYGEENLLIIRKDHEIFPLIWSITQQEREVIYQTLSPTVVWRINRDEFVAFLEQHPDALPPFIDMVLEMYRLHSERILNLEYRSARERVISFLLTMSDRFGKNSKENSIIIDVPLRHQDIASSINTSRETTSRELAYLERKGMITNTSSYITLCDVKQLRSFL